MKNTRDLFRSNLREIITRRGLKLDKAAELCDMSLSNLNQILAGKTAWSPETLDKIRSGLNCSLGELFHSEEEPKQRTELILDVQSILNLLSDDDLEVVKMTAEGRLELSQREKSKTKSE